MTLFSIKWKHHIADLPEDRYELDQHYDFHDDMEFRHTRDRLRAGEPFDEGLRSFFQQPGVERLPMPGVPEESEYDMYGLRSDAKY